LPNIVEANIPGISARPGKSVGESSCLEMPFQNEHSILLFLNQKTRGGKAAHAGADDNGVVVVLI
jgi:hypothetical protein